MSAQEATVVRKVRKRCHQTNLFKASAQLSQAQKTISARAAVVRNSPSNHVEAKVSLGKRVRVQPVCWQKRLRVGKIMPTEMQRVQACCTDCLY